MKSKAFTETPWTVKHNDNEFTFETLDAAMWYAAGVGSVSKCFRHVNIHSRLIILVPAESPCEHKEKPLPKRRVLSWEAYALLPES